MFNELLEVTREFLKKVITSRLFALAVIFTLMFIGLICKLFRMQILDGSSYQESYMQRTEKLVTTPGTRGNIYDRNGNLLLIISWLMQLPFRTWEIIQRQLTAMP